MSSKAIVFLVGIFAVMAAVAAMAFAVTSGAEADDHCNDYVCVGESGKTITITEAEGNTQVITPWKIIALRDNTQEKYRDHRNGDCDNPPDAYPADEWGPAYQPNNICSVDSSQQSSKGDWNYTYKCQKSELKTKVYVVYERHGAVDVFPGHDNGDDQDFWDNGLAFTFVAPCSQG